MIQEVRRMQDNNILKYDKLKEMLDKVYEYMERKEYKEAYYKAAALIEYININILIKKFNIKLEDSSITNIAKEYSKKDDVLFKETISLIGEYNMVDMDRVDMSDVEYLVSEADYITKYVTENYGKLF